MRKNKLILLVLGVILCLQRSAPRRALSPVIQIVASSADDAIRSSDEKLSPYIMQNVQSSDELLGGTVGEVEDVFAADIGPAVPIGDWLDIWLRISVV